MCLSIKSVDNVDLLKTNRRLILGSCVHTSFLSHFTETNAQNLMEFIRLTNI